MEIPSLGTEEVVRRRESMDAGCQRPILFIVFGHQRTGSTLIASRLNSHPRICCHEEVFLPWVDSGPSLREWLGSQDLPQWFRAVPSVRASFLASLADVESTGGSGAVGFKLMYNQMSLWPKFGYVMPMAALVLRDPVLRRWLRTNQVLIVHILRRNLLKIVVSHELASQSGRFHSRNPPVDDRKVHLSLLALKSRLRRVEEAERAARRSIEGLPAMEIWYEDYISGGAVGDDARLCRALGQSLPPGGLSSPLRKLADDDLRNTVANYDQVVALLSGTRFERFLA